MNYYLDITLLPDAEANLGFLWHKVYQQIHLLLVEHKVSEQDSAIAVSFPLYGDKPFPLGNKLRLLAESEQQLVDLKVEQWLLRLSDYVHIKAIKAVPSNITQYAYFKRWRFKNPDKLRQEVDSRAQAIATKNGFAVEEVKSRLLQAIDNFKQHSKLPFINLRSLSTDSVLSPAERRKFLLFIECQKTSKPSDNIPLLTCYGLSRRSEAQQVAVPWF
ncbi:type I-F CRISPR-associated endoribonuclease Cas6/Csy4 [Pseudoalteromonas byunsanensis]|uniref:Type I-F CRISPR-associated endoribonuclease Cas6/Csy4 n=1 Tax=Pseudoalteromonas byunsanensis TaxID=327939 RepID=A0A1S1N2N6_9GAMM|nr:type I-F CRISPR-associated endoribonuclease Cas6/Csy4 [Pseudoalteromonas byunsanensis]OHU93626.1 type I-F CRISPR-associated endoribonuclease Cas6/Csy4 [Pseudoalteromonas byunsanensis]